MRLFSYRGDIVLDPFNGAGTTTLVAAREGRRFIGIDLSLRYCQTPWTGSPPLGYIPVHGKRGRD
ncbi:MAG: site-specific DNA-methyltransferase [Methanomicrobiales archaeon]|nr:site-specific DNA-methyltransferase [Methanomicrobiales archaeon]